MASAAIAADATLRLRGGQQTFTGNVISFDGYTYRIETQLFGIVNIDLKRFECIAGACAVETTAPIPTTTESISSMGSSTLSNDTTGSTASPATPPQSTTSTTLSTSNKLVPSELTDQEKEQFFRDFLEWNRSQPN